MIEQVNNIESIKDLQAVQTAVGVNSDVALYDEPAQKQTNIFSWRSADIKPVNGNAGDFLNVFGTTQITIKELPAGKTVLNVQAIFGLIEIYVPKNVRIVNHVIPVMSGIYSPKAAPDDETGAVPELHITGNAVFGNITIVRKYGGTGGRLLRKVMDKVVDKVMNIVEEL
jgi:hypothetical protein